MSTLNLQLNGQRPLAETTKHGCKDPAGSYNIYAKVKVPVIFEISQRTPTQPALPQVYLQNIIYSL